MAIGRRALQNCIGNFNTAIGTATCQNVTSGRENTGIGYAAILGLTTGDRNIGIGLFAGRYLANGSSANQTPENCTYIGALTKSFAAAQTNETVIGYNAIGAGNNSISFGDSNVTKTIIPYGDLGVNEASPDARLEISTETDEGHQAFTIDQNDADQAFIDFQGTSAASTANNISTWTTGNSIQGFTRQEINGTTYWMPYYDAPTS